MIKQLRCVEAKRSAIIHEKGNRHNADVRPFYDIKNGVMLNTISSIETVKDKQKLTKEYGIIITTTAARFMDA